MSGWAQNAARTVGSQVVVPVVLAGLGLISWEVVAVVAALALLGVLLAPKPPKAGPGDLTGTLATGVDPAAPRRVVIGQTRLGGVVTFAHVSGASNEYMNYVITLAGHQMQEIGDPFFNNERVPLDGSGDATGRFAGYVHCEKALGTHEQAALTALVNETRPAWGPDDLTTVALGLGSIALNGTGHTLSSPSNTALRPASITIELFWRPHRIGDVQTILAMGETGSWDWRLRQNADGTLSFIDSAGTTITSGTALGLHGSARIAMRGGAGGMQLYMADVDDTLVEEATTGTAYSGGAGSGTLRVGSLDGETPYAAGDIAYLAIWSAVRTPAEIDTDQTTELTGAEASLEGLWLMNEGSGTSAGDSDANNNDLTLNASWSTAHRQRGCALAWLRLLWNESLFSNFSPGSITFEVKGRRLYDPRSIQSYTFTAVAATDVCTAAGGQIMTGEVVRLTTTDTLPAGLALATDYYLIWQSSTTFKLATSLANARAGTAIDITDAGAGVHTVVYYHGWSDNAALAALDAVLDEDYGARVALDEQDSTLNVAAANACDEMVVVVETTATFTAVAASDLCTKSDKVFWATGDKVWTSNSGGGLPGGLAASTDYYVIRVTEDTLKLATTLGAARAGTAIDITTAGTGTHTLTRKSEPRYRADGVYLQSQARGDALRNLLSAMGGGLSHVNALWGLYAAVWRAPTVTLDEGDLRGPLKVSSLIANRDNFNAVKGMFASPDHDYQATEFPQVTNATYQALMQGNERLYRDVTFPFSQSGSGCQRLAKIMLERVQRPLRVVYPASLAAYQVQPGDTLSLDNDVLGWSAKSFEVAQAALTLDESGGVPMLGCTLLLAELDSTAYAWTAGTDEQEVVKPPASNLPNPFDVRTPSGLTFAAQTSVSEGKRLARLRLAWTAPVDQYVTQGGHIEIEYRAVGGASWLPVVKVPGATTEWNLFDVANATRYEARLRSVNSLGAKSAWVEVVQTGDLIFTWEWTSAVPLGTGLSVAPLGNPSLAALNNTDIAVAHNSATNTLRTYRFNGSIWAQVGSGLNITNAGGTVAIAALNDTDVAYFDTNNDELRTYRFNGSTWALVGSGLSIATAISVAITALDSTDVAFFGSTGELRTYRFDGSAWSLIGSGLAISGVGNPALATLNDTDVALIGSTNAELRTYRFNGSAWSLVGSGLAISSIGTPALAALNVTDVAYFDATNDELRVYRFTGSIWQQSGSRLAAIASATTGALAKINAVDIAFSDNSNDKIAAYRLAFSPY
ncbi:MAG: hypothetical protein HY323_07255 [Betaproteobacteria bacterium]|nr:hypothetical protein [Betaproteobacteria bacterium]